MTDKLKAVPFRPKVRFSQSAGPPNATEDARAFGKPKIRSIIDLKPCSVKIVKPANAVFNKNSVCAETRLNRSSGDYPNDLRPCPAKLICESAPCLREIAFTPENGAARTKKVSQTKERVKSLAAKDQRSAEKLDLLAKSAVPVGSCSSLSRLTVRSPGTRKVENQASRLKPPTAREDKENIGELSESTENVSAIDKKTVSDEKVKTADVRRTDAAEASRGTKIAASTQKATKTRPEPVRKSIKDVGLMPCAKARAKGAFVKKTIVRAVSSGRSNVYVGPGVPRQTSFESEARLIKSKAPNSGSAILSGDKLSRPEYNSIVGTIKKLQRLREEKKMKDLEHLPAVYRGLVNGKVSSALDFGANEAIYRDLVDLTIDEKQLPTRLTRSKDPEPRQRDLVPKLSDFFVPTNDDEYRNAVLPRPSSPRVLDSSNPYKISDRIFAWKESLDNNS